MRRSLNTWNGVLDHGQRVDVENSRSTRAMLVDTTTRSHHEEAGIVSPVSFK